MNNTIPNTELIDNYISIKLDLNDIKEILRRMDKKILLLIENTYKNKIKN